MALIEKYVAESRVYDFNCDADLGTDETITGTPTIAASASGLTLGTAVVNDETITYGDGTTVAAGKVIQVLIGGGTQGTVYTLTATYTTSNSETQVAVVWLRIL